MRCSACKHGRTYRGRATVTLANGTSTVVLKNVPVQICPECGEEFLSPRIARKLLAQADLAANAEF